MRGEQVNADQTGHSGRPLQHRGKTPAQLPVLSLGKSQQQNDAAEGGQNHYEGPQGELAGNGIQG